MVEITRVVPEGIKIKALIYGNPGAGKTTFAAQANDHPLLRPALFLSFEGGLLSVAHRGDVDEVRIMSMKDLEDAYIMLRDKRHPFDKFETVIIDSGSELYNRSLQEAVEGRHRNHDPDTIEIGDYGKAGYQTLRLFRAFRDLSLHVVTTAHPKFTYPSANNANSEPTSVAPAFSPRLATSLMGIFDFVWYMYAYDDKDTAGNVIQNRGMLTTKRGAYEAKTRGPNFQKTLGQIVMNPNLAEVYEVLLQTEKATQDHLPIDDTPLLPQVRVAEEASTFLLAEDVQGE